MLLASEPLLALEQAPVPLTQHAYAGAYTEVSLNDAGLLLRNFVR